MTRTMSVPTDNITVPPDQAKLTRSFLGGRQFQVFWEENWQGREQNVWIGKEKSRDRDWT